MKRLSPSVPAALLAMTAVSLSAPTSAQHLQDARSTLGSMRVRNGQTTTFVEPIGAPTLVYQDTIRGGCVSGSTCITFDGANGPDGGTIVFPPVPPDALPIFGYLYFQYLTTTDCGVDRMADFVNATVNGVNINTVPFVEIACLNADACFPAVATHFYRVDVSSLFDDCDLNVATFELRGFGMGNDSSSDWVEGATLMVAYCSEMSPASDIVLVEDPQVYGQGESTPTITYSWSGFNASGGAASLVLGIGNGQNFTGNSPGDDTVTFSTNTTPTTLLGDSGTDGLFDGDLCGPGPFGNGGFYDNSIVDVSSLVNAGDSSATFTITGGADCLDSNAAFLCVESLTPAGSCIPDACQEIGCFDLNFENDDEGTLLVHGQHLGNGDPEFDGGTTFPVTIASSSGTAAILDSDTGPAGQDPDLLVGRGNVLILQTDANLTECPPASGIYCSHNDDEDGGTVTFTFASAAAPMSIDLVDIDTSDGATLVVLTDAAGGQRTYTVPGGWTGDLVDDATSGWGTLDLTSLANQPGFASMATATETAGFDGEAVVSVDVHLGGSGAIDNLSWCQARPPAAPSASVLPRNGSGLNEVRLTSGTLPRLGGTWVADLDCDAFGTGLATLTVRSNAIPGHMTLAGEQLVAGPLMYRWSQPFVGLTSRFTWAIPSDVSLAGTDLHVQGSCWSRSVVTGSKTAHVRGGLSNALDLFLGF